MSTPNAEPTTETSLEPAAEIAQPAGPPAPLPQSFKCEKSYLIRTVPSSVIAIRIADVK